MINKEIYRTMVQEVLDEHSKTITSNINYFLNRIPEEAVRVNLIISRRMGTLIDFCIHGGLNGPNLYHFNKRVMDWTHIFDFRAELIFGELYEFNIHDSMTESDIIRIIEETVSNWIDDNKSQIDTSTVKVAISIYCDNICS